ncbi:MAG: tRNA epoxyqueuosine(34) reductase QueG [Burkholderiales bacterium]
MASASVQSIKDAALRAGFDLAGVAPVRDLPELAYFPEWIASGYSGEMEYLERRDDSGRLKRESVENVAPWARSTVVCALNYNTAEPYSTEYSDRSRGWISRYAWGSADYHNVVLKRLRTLESELRALCGVNIETRCYVDTGPVVERVLAQHAGIGWVGKNTCVINQQAGSWLFLGVILTSLELTPDLPAPDRCGSCTRCINACPTEALIAPHRMDATRCISYLTIEKRGEIPEALRDGMGRHVFGCDICQDVCPWNRKAAVTTAAEFQPRPELVNPSLEWLATISEEEFAETFRGSPVRRAKRSGLRRNAVVAMGNSGYTEFLPLLDRLACDEDPVVAEHAAWAIKRLQSEPALITPKR